MQSLLTLLSFFNYYYYYYYYNYCYIHFYNLYHGSKTPGVCEANVQKHQIKALYCHSQLPEEITNLLQRGFSIYLQTLSGTPKINS